MPRDTRPQVPIGTPDGDALEVIATKIRGAAPRAKFNLTAKPGRQPTGHRGLTQLADLANVAPSFVSYLLSRRSPDVAKSAAGFLRLAKALDVSPFDLMAPEWLELDEGALGQVVVDEAHSLVDEPDTGKQPTPRLSGKAQRPTKRRPA